MQLLEQCRQKCRENPLRIVFPDTDDVRLLYAAHRLKAEGLARPILLGNPFLLRDRAHQVGLSMPCLTVLAPEQAGCFSEMTTRYCAKQKKSLDSAAAEALLKDELAFSAMMLAEDYADLCIAGNLSTTGDVIRAAIRGIGLAPDNKTVSSFFLMLSPDGRQELAFADAGVIPAPTTEQLADIAIATADNFYKVTHKKPYVAMLSFSTKGSAIHEDAGKIWDATELVRQRRPDIIIDGEVQFDAAFVPDVARKKMPNSPLKDGANVFVFPSLSAGNIAYKVAQRMGGYIALGPMLQGLAKPMHDLSRGCSADDIVDISVLTSAMAMGDMQ